MRASLRWMGSLVASVCLTAACGEAFTTADTPNDSEAGAAGQAPADGGAPPDGNDGGAPGSSVGGAGAGTIPPEAGAPGAGGEPGVIEPTTIANCSASSFSGGTCRDVIGIGAYSACAIAADGSVKCWGLNEHLQLGDAATKHEACGDGSKRDCSSKPVVTKPLENPVLLAGGETTQCGLNEAGNLYCWGLDLRKSPDADVSAPTQFGTSEGNVGLSLRFGFGVLPGDGTAWVGGIDLQGTGIFGSGASMAGERRYLGPVKGIDDAVALDVGWYHACAVRERGRIACWGKGIHGELGQGKKENSFEPVEVQQLESAVRVAVGDAASCALKDDGHVACWGSSSASTGTVEVLEPKDVVGFSDAVDVKGGFGHFCALRESGKVSCWGVNDHGQLGAPIDTAGVIEVSGLSDATAIGLGARHSCALKATGKLVCWGAGAVGQLGNGAFEDSPTPVAVVEL